MKPQEILERAADRCPLDDHVVIVKERSEANLRWAGNTLTTNGVMQGRSVTVVAIDHRGAGSAAGVVSRSVVDAGELESLVDAATEAARSADVSPDGAALVDGGVSPDFSSGPAETSAEVFAAFAPQLGEAFAAAGAEGRELFGFAEHVLTTSYLSTSSGTRLRHVQPTGKLEMTGKSDGRRRSSWVGQYTRDFTDVDVVGHDRELARRLAWEDRQIALPAGHYDVVMPPGAVSDLLVYAYVEMAARDAAEGRTAYSRAGGGTRVGDRLSSRPLQLFSDPSYPGLECEPFVTASSSSSLSSVFDNGLPLGRSDWIRDGQLEALLQTRYSAGLTDLPTTPFVDNLILEVSDGSGTLEDVVARTERGLLLSTLWYIREVDPQSLLLTGLTRDGVYLVEGGEVVGAVNNFRFNESPLDLLSRVADAGSPTVTLPREWNDFFARVAMAPLRISDFNMSTVSQAS
ncbi:MAG: metallopeptidase TldD-related protein [Actinomycetes bacterium]